jgi:hypothetical protein
MGGTVDNKLTRWSTDWQTSSCYEAHHMKPYASDTCQT